METILFTFAALMASMFVSATCVNAAEVQLHGPNDLGLIAVKGELGEALINTDDLLQAALRLRPDRILLGELRGKEAVSFLRAVNTGHPGSFSTIHANSTSGALEQLALMVVQIRARPLAD